MLPNFTVILQKMAIWKGVLFASLLILICHTQSTQAQLDPEVKNVYPTEAVVSWTPSDATNVAVVLSKDGKDIDAWPTNNRPERVLFNLKEFTEYKVCVFQTNETNQMNEDEECVEFRTPFKDRSKAAFGCASFLILSFCIVTILDFICGTVRPNTDQQKQEELLEEGNKVFKTRRKAKRKAAKLAKQLQNADGEGIGKAGRNRASIMSDATDASSEAPLSPPLSTVGEGFDIDQWIASGMGGEPETVADTSRLSAAPSEQYGITNSNYEGNTAM